MRRREFITLLGGAVVTPVLAPLTVRAQQSERLRRIGAEFIWGMSVYIYSDGITEATNSAGELFSEQRLEAILRNAPVG